MPCKYSRPWHLSLHFKKGTMPNTDHTYLYKFNFDATELELCSLEVKCLFDASLVEKHLFSEIEVDPSQSAFIKSRLKTTFSSTSFDSLLNEIKNQNIHAELFKVEYLVFKGDETPNQERLQKLRDIGYSIEGLHEYYQPTITYGLCYCDGLWYFGALLKDSLDWHKHQQKPHSFSNSIGVNMAKSLVNIAAQNNKGASLLDACCGMGTIMLEACFSGNTIEGCEINHKTYVRAKANLAHFQYTSTIHHKDVKELNKKYDAAIIDLPYNLFTLATNEEVAHIIQSTSRLADRLVIVSISDISIIINQVGFQVMASCMVRKKGKTKFARRIWVCERRK